MQSKMPAYTRFIIISELDEYRWVHNYYVPSNNEEITPELITDFMSTELEYGKLVLEVFKKWRRDETVFVIVTDKKICYSSKSGDSVKFETPISISQEYMIWKSGEFNFDN